MRPFGILLLSLVAGPLVAQEPSRAEVDFFETKIRPVLAEHCFAFHSANAEKGKKLKAALRLDTRADMRQGGDSGSPIVPGDPANSLLVRVLQHDSDVRMPPIGRQRRLSLGVARSCERVNYGRPKVRGKVARLIESARPAACRMQGDRHAGVGVHEVLGRQGLMGGRWCLDENEDLSPGQMEEIDRVCAAYPHLQDDHFVREHIDDWMK